jgi:4-amino-4-deoxy-L-arabinose transferase-like glycosyltransferase
VGLRARDLAASLPQDDTRGPRGRGRCGVEGRPLEAPALLKPLRGLTPQRAAALAFALALAVRLALAFSFGDRLIWPDEHLYDQYGTLVAHGNLLGPPGDLRGYTLAPPGQYFTVGAVYALAGSRVLKVRIFQALVSALSVLLLYRLLRRLSVGVALVATFVLALYPLVIYTAETLYPQTMGLFWLLGAVNLLVDHVEAPSWKRLLGAGLLLGCGALTVPTILTICPVLGIWLWWARRPSWRGVAEVALLAVCVAATLVPWQIRNYKVEHRFVPIAMVGPQIFFFANNPQADPDSKDIRLVEKVYTPEVLAEIARTGKPEAVYARHAWDFIQHDTGRFLLFYVKRLGHFFDFEPHTFTSNEHTGRGARLLVGLTSAPALLLALAGALGLLRRSRLGALLVVLPLSWGLTSALFGVSIRYRVPVEPYILAVAAWALWHYGLRREERPHAQIPSAPRVGA